MNITTRRFPRDEELGKKDDDHDKLGKATPWASWRARLRYRKRRIISLCIGLFVLWLFVHHMPEPLGPVERDTDRTDDARHYFSGPIKFYRLGRTLHGIAKTWGYQNVNRNVLFAASNLRSASVLIPIACDMAKWNRNYVHVVFMGRDNMDLDEILEINGVDREDCDVFWHDARPDYSEYSSDSRAEKSVAAALGYISDFMHPQVIITDEWAQEDAFFERAMHSKVKLQRHPVIQLPKGDAEKFGWMTRLDAGSLSAWHKSAIDILIHAPSESSGSLIRTIKSIQDADYQGLQLPRIIVELPPEIDPPTKRFLDSLVWPPSIKENPSQSSQLILRHRIPTQKLSAEEASIRFMESFYPAASANSHVLLLSPQAQLSPLYYHYLKYNLLEYRYSTYDEEDRVKLFGISLELPSTQLNGTSPFTPPAADAMNDPKYSKHKGVAPFLWQAPNSNAALCFGDKWIELHSFLSNRVAKQHSASPPKPRAKLVSPAHPSWTEYHLELMRARGYWLLYPGLPPSEALVTIHNELYHPPEEFAPVTAAEKKSAVEPPKLSEHDPFIVPASPPPAPSTHEAPLVPPSRPLHFLLPELLSPADAEEAAAAYAAKFRKEVGGCGKEPRGMKRVVKAGSAGDLFCFDDEENEEFENVAAVPTVVSAEVMETSSLASKSRTGSSSSMAMRTSEAVAELVGTMSWGMDRPVPTTAETDGEADSKYLD
ncbi:hypothetical protein H2199_003720 [Coniosporium tulheliwenetii]|uniref:Uncharacterized protein n=1 Tax=Coniosporium tulheliwenetii TaxID=3383036 RepID=A0ACC2ZAF7_9PEZI|nr:hypothetical protein H2199_003720 [Cladosporium sp. JES 115]